MRRDKAVLLLFLSCAFEKHKNINASLATIFDTRIPILIAADDSQGRLVRGLRLEISCLAIDFCQTNEKQARAILNIELSSLQGGNPALVAKPKTQIIMSHGARKRHVANV